MEDVFDVLVKAYKDVRRVRERVEALKHVNLSEEAQLMLRKIREEARKILGEKSYEGYQKAKRILGEKSNEGHQKESRENEKEART